MTCRRVRLYSGIPQLVNNNVPTISGEEQIGGGGYIKQGHQILLKVKRENKLHGSYRLPALGGGRDGADVGRTSHLRGIVNLSR